MLMNIRGIFVELPVAVQSFLYFEAKKDVECLDVSCVDASCVSGYKEGRPTKKKEIQEESTLIQEKNQARKRTEEDGFDVRKEKKRSMKNESSRRFLGVKV